jgi:hypothetical protein
MVSFAFEQVAYGDSSPERPVRVYLPKYAIIRAGRHGKVHNFQRKIKASAHADLPAK